MFFSKSGAQYHEGVLLIKRGAEYHELANKGVLNIMIDLREGCFLSGGGAEYHE